MIIFDTETTGFTKPGVVDIAHQPEIIEFGAIRVNESTLEIDKQCHFFCKPRILPLSPEIVKATNITTEMLVDKKPFSTYVPSLTAFFLGEETMVSHNCGYDRDVMMYELTRVDRLTRFPWPWQHIDTVELTMDIPAPRQKSARLKLSELYQALTSKQPAVKHRALDDVMTLYECVVALRKLDGRI